MADGSSSSETTPKSVLALTARIVSAHVAHNPVAAKDLGALIQSVYGALSGAAPGLAAAPAPSAAPQAAKERPRPAVPIAKSVFDTHIVCLEDGRKLKMLRRHLQTAYGLSPEQYRVRWGLDPDYPMVAPEYAKRRSNLAKAIGLGTRTRERT